ncbi:MAG: BCCT family transporter [Corynebacterium glucuronolyticum]|nr:BCCT family transporter [Corynebacterium glucuronolyticum]
MSFFGNSALDRILGGDAECGAVAMNEPQRGFYELIASYPGGTILIFLTTIIGLLLYITSADSGALVLSNFTARITDSQQDGATWSRVVWSVIIYMIMASLVKSLQLETYQDKSRIIARHERPHGYAILVDPAASRRHLPRHRQGRSLHGIHRAVSAGKYRP